MEYAEKMFLVPQNQLEQIRTGTQDNIRRTVETDLDTTIRKILTRQDLDPYEKVKQYSVVLQRYLNIIKQGTVDDHTLTLRLPSAETAVPYDNNGFNKIALQTPAITGARDQLVDSILKNIPTRQRKKAEYILQQMERSKDITAWSKNGEFILNGRTLAGTHLMDLIQNITAPHNVADPNRPRGWDEFLNALSAINIPDSSISNRSVRQKIGQYKNITPTVADIGDDSLTPSNNVYKTPSYDVYTPPKNGRKRPRRIMPRAFTPTANNGASAAVVDFDEDNIVTPRIRVSSPQADGGTWVSY